MAARHGLLMSTSPAQHVGVTGRRDDRTKPRSFAANIQRPPLMFQIGGPSSIALVIVAVAGKEEREEEREKSLRIRVCVTDWLGAKGSSLSL